MTNINIENIKNKLEYNYYKILYDYSKKNNINYEWLNNKVNILDDNIITFDQNLKKEKDENNSETNENQYYNKPWIKLNIIHKIIKIKEYVNTLNYNSQDEKNELLDKLIELTKNKILTKKDKINYDETNGKIISIINLEYKDKKYIYNNK